jgi:hypothetical protein
MTRTAPSAQKARSRRAHPGHCWSIFRSAWFVDIVGMMGFDFHSSSTPSTAGQPADAGIMIRAPKAAGDQRDRPRPQRAARDPALPRHRAAGIQIPHIDDAVDAPRRVAAIRYPPLGDRGLATVTRAAGLRDRRIAEGLHGDREPASCCASR